MPPLFSEYLVSYGVSGEFVRCIASGPSQFDRGDRLVIRSPRGVELGTVLCAATAGHAAILGDENTARVLRPLSIADEDRLELLARESDQVLAAARGLFAARQAPAEVLDVEALLDPRTFVLHLVGMGTGHEADIAALSSQFNCQILLAELPTPAAEEADEHESGVCSHCGREGGGCGSSGEGGGCGSCATGCGTAAPPTSDEWKAYFMELRVKLHERVPPLSVKE